MARIVYDKETFIRGMAISDDGVGGGFSYSQGINITENPGQVQPHDDGLDQSKGADAQLHRAIAVYNGSAYIFAEDTADIYGRIERYDMANDSYGGGFDIVDNVNANVSSAGVGYHDGTTDAIYFSWNLDILRINLGVTFNDAAITDTWWSGTRGYGAMASSLHRPLHVFEKILWIGNNSNLSSYESTGSTEQALALEAKNTIVTLSDIGIYVAMGVLQGVVTASNATVPGYGNSNIMLWDPGLSPTTPNYTYPIPGTIYALKNVGGTLYAIVRDGDYITLWQFFGIVEGFRMVHPDLGMKAQGRTTSLDGMTAVDVRGDNLYIMLRDDTDTSNRFAHILRYGPNLPGAKPVLVSEFVLPNSTTNQYSLGALKWASGTKLLVSYKHGTTRDLRMYDRYALPTNAANPESLIRLPAISDKNGSRITLDRVKLVFDKAGTTDDYDIYGRVDFSGSFALLQGGTSGLMADGSAAELGRGVYAIPGGLEGEHIELEIRFPNASGKLRKVIVDYTPTDIN